MIPNIVRDSLASVGAALWARKYVLSTALALAIAWFAACHMSGCVHQDGAPVTSQEVWKFEKQLVLNACRTHRAGGSVVLALGGNVPAVVAIEVVGDLICTPIEAMDAWGVVATRETVRIIPRPRCVSGGEQP